MQLDLVPAAELQKRKTAAKSKQPAASSTGGSSNGAATGSQASSSNGAGGGARSRIKQRRIFHRRPSIASDSPYVLVSSSGNAFPDLPPVLQYGCERFTFEQALDHFKPRETDTGGGRPDLPPGAGWAAAAATSDADGDSAAHISSASAYRQRAAGQAAGGRLTPPIKGGFKRSAVRGTGRPSPEQHQHQQQHRASSPHVSDNNDGQPQQQPQQHQPPAPIREAVIDARAQTFQQVYWVCDASWPTNTAEQVRQ
jgi:hypothetical protein